MKRCNNEPSSSLDMLLDTMCNVFGATIFLAISLFVIASMIKNDVSTIEKQNARTVAAMAKELDTLADQAKKLASEVSLKSEMIKRVKNDPRLENFVKIAELSDRNHKLQQQMDIEQMKRTQAELAAASEQALLSKINEIIEQQRTANKKMDKELLKIQSEIINEKKNLAKPSRNMVLNKLQKASDGEMPYYVIAKAGKLWRIGPDQASAQVIINDDVKYTQIQNSYQCIPDTTKGTAILSGDSVSASTMQLISNLPAGRYPCFQVYPDCAQEYFRLVESLKAKSSHYATATKLMNDPAGFTFVDKQIEYER